MNKKTTTTTDETKIARAALELVSDPVFVIDSDRERIVDVNRAACEALGLARQQLVGSAWSDTAVIVGETTVSYVDEHRVLAVTRKSSACKGPDDVRRDPLTGLAGRDALAPHRRPALDCRSPSRCGLLFIDLDGFKHVNDTWGHPVGDRVLQITAQRLCDNVRPHDLVVRWGGDEFVVLAAGVARRRDVRRLADRIAKALEEPMFVESREMTLSASIGVAQSGASSTSIDTLIAVADRAMYRAKKQGLASMPAGCLVGPLAPRKSLIAYHTWSR
jgi:diguanylate cyclase (GGDEF)-like protein